MAIDRNKELKKLHTFNDKAADSITKVAGSMPFLLSEHRTELDYRSDLKAEVDIRVMLGILERLAHHQSVDIRDLLAEMEGDERKASRSARQFSE
jgi:uncharacterized membrane protein